MKLTGLARGGGQNTDKGIIIMDNINSIAHRYRIYFTSRKGGGQSLSIAVNQRYFDTYRLPTFESNHSIWTGSALGFLWLLSKAQFRVTLVIKAPNVAVAP